MLAPATSAGRGQEGTTLVEVLVAVAILGIAFVAVLGGMATSIMSSDIHRKQADSMAVLTRYAEVVKAAGYTACASTYSPPFSPPSGYQPSVTGVRYWDGTAFQASCGPDKGLQRVSLKLEVSPSSGPPETLDVIKRAP